MATARIVLLHWAWEGRPFALADVKGILDKGILERTELWGQMAKRRLSRYESTRLRVFALSHEIAKTFGLYF